MSSSLACYNATSILGMASPGSHGSRSSKQRTWRKHAVRFMQLFGQVCQRPKSILLHLCLGISCMIVCCQVDEAKIPDARRRPSDTILKCLTCKELIWILSINTDFMVSQDPTLVNTSSLASLLRCCKYPEWTADYEINFDVERSEYHVNLLGKKRARRDTWHDEYLLKGCKFVYKSKGNDIATEVMKYVDNKQKLAIT